jgi:hypothetical protein
MAADYMGFAYNSLTTTDRGMKFDAGVPWGVARIILLELTNPIYITAAILQNGGRFEVFSLLIGNDNT